MMSNSLTEEQIDTHLDTLAKSQSLESYCTNCGSCCQPSVTVKSVSASPFKILVKDLSCKFNKSINDESTCTVYSDRFEKAAWCLDLKGMISEGVAPNDCPYVDTLKGYKPTISLNPLQYESVLPLLRKAIISSDTSPFSNEDITEFLGD